MGKYRKTIAALVGSTLTWGTAVVASPAGPPTAGEWLALGFAAATALGVYGVTNREA